MDKLERLISERRYADAAAVAIYTNKTYTARRLFSNDKHTDREKVDAFEDLLLADAAHDFDCYCRFVDYRQPLGRNFYLDRRKYLKEIADTLTNMYYPKAGMVEYDVLRIKLRTRSGKSEFFNRAAFWVQGGFPNGETLHCVGGGMLQTNIYEKRLQFIDEYWDRHIMVFPDAKTSVSMMEYNPSISFTSNK